MKLMNDIGLWIPPSTIFIWSLSSFCWAWGPTASNDTCFGYPKMVNLWHINARQIPTWALEWVSEGSCDSQTSEDMLKLLLRFYDSPVLLWRGFVQSRHEWQQLSCRHLQRLLSLHQRGNDQLSREQHFRMLQPFLYLQDSGIPRLSCLFRASLNPDQHCTFSKQCWWHLIENTIQMCSHQVHLI